MKKEMRWLKKDEIALAKAVRKFNASITNISKKHPELADVGLLPEKLSVSAIKASEPTRKDFNNILSSIDRWFKKGNRDIITRGGVKMTRWEYKETLYANQRLIANKKKRLAASTRSIRQQGRRENEIKTVDEKLREIERKLTSDLGGDYGFEEARGSWKIFRKRVLSQSTEGYQDEKDALYYYNYNKSIYENFTYSNATALSNFLEDFRLEGDELYNITGKYPEIDIEFMYSRIEEEEKLTYIMEMFPKAVKDLYPEKYNQWLERTTASRR